MRFSVPKLVWLVVVWLALWEDVSPANLLSGLAVAGTITWLHPGNERRTGRPHPVAVLRLIVYFSWKLVEATVIVSWEVLTPTSHIRQGIIAVPVRGETHALTTLVANLITLTPGTLTIDTDAQAKTLYVHVLHLRDPEAVRRDVRHLEALAIAAFGGRGAVERLGGSPSAHSLEPSQATAAVRDLEEGSDR